MTETSFTNPTPEQSASTKRQGRSKPARLALVGALVLGVAGVAIGYPAFSHDSDGPSQGWGGPRHGWMHEDGMSRGWHPPFGGEHFGRHHEERGRGRHGMAIGPGSVERMVDRLASATDASSDQRQKMNAIAQAAAQDVLSLRQRHRAGREQLRALLTAPSIDRGKLETLRAEQMKLAEEASKRITTAVADIAEVLNPAQREELGRMLERHRGRRL
jgi:protein CpxP